MDKRNIIARVNTNLNKRTGLPDVNAPNDGYYKKGEQISIIDIVNGSNYKGNKVWYKLEDGSYVWSGGVEGIETLNSELTKTVSNNETNKINALDWWHVDYEIPRIWETYKTKGSDVTIAVFDSGLLDNSIYFDYSKIDGQNLINNTNKYNDSYGHGTSVSSIMVANGPELIGICPESNLYMCKFYKPGSDNKKANFERLIHGIKNLPEKTDIIVISYSFFPKYQDENEISELEDCLKSVSKDVFIICSNGDEAYKKTKVPAAYESVLRIAAIDNKNEIYVPSNPATNIFLSAPGVDMKVLTLNNNVTTNNCGSSFAVPFTAGIISLIISFLKKKNIKINTKDLIGILAKSTTRKTPLTTYGNGIINPLKAMELTKKKYKS